MTRAELEILKVKVRDSEARRWVGVEECWKENIIDLIREVDRWHEMVVDLNDCTDWENVKSALREWVG